MRRIGHFVRVQVPAPDRLRDFDGGAPSVREVFIPWHEWCWPCGCRSLIQPPRYPESSCGDPDHLALNVREES